MLVSEKFSCRMYAMSDHHRAVLRRNRVFLLKNVMINDLLFDHLQEDNIITEDMREYIFNNTTTRRRIGELLDIIPKRGPKAYECFIKALVASDQYNTARFLEEAARQSVTDNV